MQTISATDFAKRYGAAATVGFDVPTTPGQTPVAPSAPGYFSRVASDIGGAVGDAAQKLKALPPNPSLPNEISAGLNVAKNATGAAVAPIAEAPGVKQVGELFGAAGKAIAEKAMENPQYALVAAKLAQFLDQNPEVGDALATAGNVAALDGAGATGKAALDLTRLGAKTANTALSSTADGVASAARDLRTRVQSLVGSKTVNPQLKTSAGRLAEPSTAESATGPFLEGTKAIGDPASLYDKYLAQSKTAIVDAKADPAIATVGSEIGDSFKSVVDQRRAVGKVMGEELKAVGTTPVTLTPAIEKLDAALNEAGVGYRDGEVHLTDTAKIAPEDATLIQRYLTNLEKLGPTPNLAQVDALISRMDAIVDYEKSAKGMISTTNGERIVKSSLNNLREAITPGDDPRLEKYVAARKTYSDLSNVINDGAQYLGKITESGDFAKDASIAKSAVQSILNNGKKDFLLKLQELTGHPIIDKSVLALQAMADAGDFRGLSLLQKLSDGAIPTSATGLGSKILEFALKHGARAALGSPAEQTRAFLQSLGKGSPQ